MAELKTKPNAASVAKFIASIKDPEKRADAVAVAQMMSKATRAEGIMWGSSIVGFGTYRYVYASGREGDWPLLGFSPRKGALTLYIMSGFERHPDLMQKLGTYTTGKSCLYVKRLADIHLPTLKKLMVRSVKATRVFEREAARKKKVPAKGAR
jgi:hypothetical protein